MMGDMGTMMWGACALGLGLLAVLVIALAYAVLRSQRGHRTVVPARDVALEIVRRRYAAGDIDDEEYLQRLSLIRTN